MYRALQTIVIKIDGRELQLTEGEEVQLSVNEGTVLAAGGYVEEVADDEAALPMDIYVEDEPGKG